MRQVSDEEFVEAWSAGVVEGLTAAALGARLNLTERGVFKRAAAMRARGIDLRPLSDGRMIRKPSPIVAVRAPPSPELTAGELLERKKADFRRRLAYEHGRKLIRVKVNIPGPIGILHFGDPHLDDDGTDIEALEHHIQLVKDHPAMVAANVGDTTNNWVGRLARLYAEQHATAREAWTLAEWFIRELEGKWLYIIAGNHDAWSGAGDPLNWITQQASALYESSEVRLGLAFPGGKTITINARHDFAGESQWNPAHGPMKAAQLGIRDDILICGHRHKSGYSPLKDPESGKVCHCIQVASYKRYDRYARERGFRDQSLSPCVVTVIDPEQTKPEAMVHVFWDADVAADFLTWLREKRGYSKEGKK